DEKASAASQHLALHVQNLGHVDMSPSSNAHLPRVYAQRLIQRDWLQVFHCDSGGQSYHLTQLVHLAHGLVEDGRDDAAVAVSRRPGIAFAQAEAAHEASARLVIVKLEAHTVGVVLAAGETIIPLQLDVTGIVP